MNRYLGNLMPTLAPALHKPSRLAVMKRATFDAKVIRCSSSLPTKRDIVDQTLSGKGHTMRMSYVCLLLTAFAVPAAAADADQNLKQVVEKIGAAYSENFNKQNAAGIAALYATGGMQVNQAGPTTDVAKRYEGVFKAGV